MLAGSYVNNMFTFQAKYLFIVTLLITSANYGQDDLTPCWEIDYNQYPRQIEVDNSAQNGFFPGDDLVKRLPVQPVLTERDVVFAKRVWSSIELKEKANHALYYPLNPKPNLWSLWNVIRYGLEVEQSLTAYLPGVEMDDAFKYPLRPSDSTYCLALRDLLYQSEYVDSLNENGEPIYDSITSEYLQKEISTPIMSDDIVKYLIKEDWVFDRQRSTMEKRIIGIAPVIADYDEFGDIRGNKTLFWLYFPECEYVFQNHTAIQREFEPKMISYTDVFRKRMFTSVVYKESNESGDKINARYSGKNALLESERIKRKHENLEHDLWSY